MISIKTESEIARMRQAGRILAGSFVIVEKMVRPGIRAREIDRAVEECIRSQGGIPSFKNYPNAEGSPFPGSICLSIEDEVVHGFPDDRVLEEGTIVGIDIGVQFDGFHADSARSYAIGSVDWERQRLLDVTRTALEKALEQAKAGKHLSDIGHAVQTYAESNGCGVVRELVGHGIGRRLHEDPQVPNYGPPHRGPVLRSGMTLAIEPMLNLGTADVDMIGPWQVLTRDRKPSAHFEHTILVRDGNPEILTLASD